MTPSERYQRDFYLRVGQAGNAAEAHVDRYSGYLFPLPLMMDAQGELAEDCKHLVRATDPQTSKQAAKQAVMFKGKHAAKIFGWLCDHATGGTKDEIAAGTGIDAISVARRMKELCRTAGVYDSGETRRTPTGRAAIVWKVRRD